jgi:hypothetical protein
MPLEEWVIPYVAGLFDGEGCFDLYRHRQSLVPRAQVTNTNREALERLVEWFGGRIERLWRVRANWKQSFRWVLSNQPALDFMATIEPYLSIKSEQALLAMATDCVRPGRGRRWDAGTRDLLLAQSRWNNFRGVGRGPSPMAVEAAACR